ncbi:Pho80p cyclin [Conoideocrella luteorostrata]|uniref:Pho80p cyclin n=1 Tax=Conoideocrella luteorostrata TaxID=1105319 RepID=A0AAJ0FVJ4_9HYPO|nr:Pho80p cyclin [Conoideocrella luteorostrata]
MLKSSPVLASAAHGSSTSFRHGHATSRSPQVSPRPSTSTLAGPAYRRPSLTSATPYAGSNAPRHPRANTYTVAPSAALQHNNVDSQQAISAAADSPRPEQNLISAQPAQPQPKSGPDHQAQQVLSPNKRRVSGGGGSENATPQTAGPSGSQVSPSATTAPKRARTDGEPPKVLPQQYEHCAVQDIVELIAHMLAELISTNDSIRISSGGLTRFHSRTAPGISVRDYLHRLARHATLTPPLLLAMVYYIDRLCALYPEFTINTLTVHRFLITAATVAAKGLSDSFWNNTTYARVGGVRLAELKLLELEFLYRVDWKIVPNPEVLVAYYQGLVERTPQYTLESEGSSSDSSVGDDDDNIGDAQIDEEKRQPDESQILEDR